MLEVKNLAVRCGSLTIVENIDFAVDEGRWVMLIGPNGAGKSTIVNAISQGAPYSGAATYDGKDIAKMKPTQRARHIGVLSQNHYVAYSFTVGEVVKLGRYSHSSSIFGPAGDADHQSVRRALEITGLTPFENQPVPTLSGGELQRTFLAQIFAQDPNLLILDEPTNHLDLVYQKQMFDLIREWLRTPGRAVLSVVHDLGLARAYGTDAILLHRGHIVSSGPMEAVLTRENLQKAYGMDVHRWMRDMLARWED